MDFFLNHKKEFSSLGIILLLVPLLFGIGPQKAMAIVPVMDAPAEASLSAIAGSAATIAANTPVIAAQTTKQATEFSLWTHVLKPLAWAMAKAFLRQLTQNIVEWIRNGFEGKPLFIRDFGRFMTQTTNTAVGIFIDNFASPAVQNLLCGPFRGPVLQAVLKIPTPVQPICTLNVVIKNAQGMANYMKNFTQGGWKSFISFSTQSVNNPYGAYLSARGNLEATQMKAQQKASTEATMNSGFLGVRSCAPGGRNSRGDCIEWQVDSPGKFVEAQLGWSSTSELRTLELANDIDQIVGALANLLVTKLLSSALGGVAGNSGGPASTLPPTPVPPTAQQDLLNMVSQFTASETLFRNTKQANLTTYSSTTPVYNSALACYTNYATAWNNCTGIRSAVSIATVNNAVSNITYNLNAINNITIPRFNAEISNSNNLITQLSSLQAGVIAATLASQLDTLTNNFYALQSSLHNSYHQYQAEQQTQAAQDQANDAANQQTNCSALPAACN